MNQESDDIFGFKEVAVEIKKDLNNQHFNPSN